MSPAVFFLTLFSTWLFLYVIVPMRLIFRTRIVAGGLIQLIGALLPEIWHRIFWPDEAGTFGLLTILLLLLPIGFVAYGLIVGLVRTCWYGLRMLRGTLRP